MTLSLLIATTNQGKLIEMQELLSSLPVNLVLPKDLGIQLEVEEDGRSYAENAAKKARAFCEASGLLTLADDSGLEVDLLNGEPGIYSARYSGQPGATDADRRQFLLHKLAGLPHPWKAHFHSTVAIAAPHQTLIYAEGNCPGEIIEQERGTNGFGYDPVFWLPDRQCTMAELSNAEKNRLSHRARALQMAIPLLQPFL